VLKTKNKAIKFKCYWFQKYGIVRNGCKILTELQCDKRGKCTFCETEAEYEARQANFKKRLARMMR